MTILVILWIGLSMNGVLAQENDYSKFLEDLEEESVPGEIDWLENLWDLQQHPLNLNTAEEEDLLEIPFLSPDLAHRIVRWRRKNHPGFTSPKDLLQIDGFTQELLEAMTPFIRAGPVRVMPTIFYRYQGSVEFPRRQGYVTGAYQNPFYLLQ